MNERMKRKIRADNEATLQRLRSNPRVAGAQSKYSMQEFRTDVYRLFRRKEIYLILGVSGFMFLLILGDRSGSHSADTSSSSSTGTMEAYDTPSPNQFSTNTPDTVTVFTMNSNGETWHSASDSAKQELCQRLAGASLKGNSASFYYDLLESTYNTTNEYTLRQTIDDVTRLGEAASSSQ